MILLDTLLSLAKIIFALVLVFLNAIFVAAEFAFVKVRPTRITQLIEEGNKRAESTRECISNIDAYLSVSQLGITLVSLGLGWLGEPAISTLITPLLFTWGISSPALVHSISFIIAFSIITFLHVVFGELAPKSLAIQRAEAISLRLSRPMKLFYRLFYPAVTLLNGTANAVIARFGFKPASEGSVSHTEEEIRIIISESYASGHIKESEKELLQNVFRFETLVAEDIMIPRTEVLFLDTTLSLQENLDKARTGGHTRFPLCNGSSDRVIGLINIKDLIYAGDNIADISSLKRDIIYIPASMPLDRLLPLFQEKHQHLAIVLDEYGGTAGIITLENVLEELVGEIQDEYDDEEPDIKKEDDGSFIVTGRMIIEDVEEKFGLQVHEEEFNTLAGLVLEKLGKKPRVGDVIIYEGFNLEILKMKGMRIDRIRISPVQH